MEGGRAWRQDKMERYGAPEVDWPCPRGHEWGYEPPERAAAKQKPDPPFVAQRRKACKACGEEACFLKRMLKTKPCAFRARIVRPGMVCPLERWT